MDISPNPSLDIASPPPNTPSPKPTYKFIFTAVGLIILVSGIITLFGVPLFSTVVRAAIPEAAGDFPQNANVCRNWWWRDDTHTNCSHWFYSLDEPDAGVFSV